MQTTHAGGALHYQIVDQRLPWAERDETIVFHHGLGACAAVWSGWFSALAERYRLVALDMRGHGRSPAPDSWDCSVEALVEDLHAVADIAAGERFHLVGESIGGTVALAFAAAYPGRVHTLTVSNGAHRGAGIENLSPWAEIIDAGGMKAWSEHMMHMRFVAGAISAPMWRWYEAQQSRCNAGTVLKAAAVLVATDLASRLERIQMPVLLMHPDASPFIPVSVMDELRRALPNARLSVFPGARHGLPFSHASACARQLVGFLLQCERTADAAAR